MRKQRQDRVLDESLLQNFLLKKIKIKRVCLRQNVLKEMKRY